MSDLKTALFFLKPIVALLGMMPSALADQNSYDFTVHMICSGLPVTIFVQTGDSQYVSTQQPKNISLTFNIPQNQGDSIKVCIDIQGLLLPILPCQSWTVYQHSGSYSVYIPCGSDNSTCITNPITPPAVD